MRTLIEYKALGYLSELNELIEMSDRGEEEYSSLRREKELIEASMVNPSLDLGSAFKQRSIGYGNRKAVNYENPQRVTRIYFSDVGEEQAKGYGMKWDKGNGWYINTWGYNLKITELDLFVKSKAIPFSVQKFKVFGGKIAG